MKRLVELEARRQVLLERCDQQRVELAYQISQIKPAKRMASWTLGAAPHALGKAFGNNPMAFIAGLAGLLLMRKPVKLLSWVPWLAGALSLVTRVASVLRIIAQIRALRSTAR